MPVSLVLPDIPGSYQRGYTFGLNQRLQREKEERERNYNRLAGEAYNAPDAAARDAALGQLATTDPDHAATLRDAYQTRDDTRARRAGNIAKGMLDAVRSGDDATIQGYWRAVRPYMQELNPGAEVPETFTPEMAANLHQAVARSMGAGTGQAETVQSTRIGADGYYYTVDRSGNWTNSGIKADPRTQLRDQPGIAPGIVDLRTGGVSPLQGAQQYGQPQQAQIPPQYGQGAPAGPAVAGTGSNAYRLNIEGIDPAFQQRLADAMSMMKQAGMPDDQIDAFLQAQLSQPRNGTSPQPQPQPQMQQPAPQPFAPANAGPAAMRPAAQSGAIETFSQPQTVVGPDGQPRLVQFGNQGSQREVQGYRAPGDKPMTEYQRQQLQMKSGKARTAMNSTLSELDRMGEAVRRVMRNSHGLTGITGVRGVFPNMPGSDAANARADLDALKSQIGLSVLQQMRAMSPTGGALGNVSDAEGRRLEANLASLDTAQSTEQLMQRLGNILQYIEQAKANLRSGYDEQFGEQGAAPQGSAAGQSGWGIREIK